MNNFPFTSVNGKAFTDEHVAARYQLLVMSALSDAAAVAAAAAARPPALPSSLIRWPLFR